MIREIVTIDEDKCDGCGLCVPACAEGAIKIIDGKAKLLAENLCDGLGACLGHCPQDAGSRNDLAENASVCLGSLCHFSDSGFGHAGHRHHALPSDC